VDVRGVAEYIPSRLTTEWEREIEIDSAVPVPGVFIL
tara:strand:- start:491 stop:601 length:111 start_codon:yes stop_codon:yes gene_type:complete